MQTNTAAAGGRQLRIFFVEDSAQVRERLESTASLAGAHAVGHAEGADAAVRAILAERPDMVLLDLQLAQGSGFDVLRALKREAPGIEVYVISNNADAPYRDCAARLGARGFYDKSLEFMLLLDLIATRTAAQPN